VSDYSPGALFLFLDNLQHFPVNKDNFPLVNIPSTKGNDTQCLYFPNTCLEGNLDVQYLLAISPVSPTTFWYNENEEDAFAAWLIDVANSENVPKVLSFSILTNEETTTQSEMNAFSTQAIKLGVMGVTIVAGSGDDLDIFIMHSY
jgi:hypothetical protein